MLNSNGQASLRKHNLLFDSSSLKELLGGGSTNFKERTAATKATLETIKIILKQETGSSGLKRNSEFGKKKKNGKKSKSNRAKATSLLSEFDTSTALQRASALRFSVNNVHEYAVDINLPREDVNILERNYSKIKLDMNSKSRRIFQGFEQLSGQESSEINFEDAQLLATFGEVDIDIESLKLLCFHCISAKSGDDTNAEHLRIDFNLFMTALQNFCKLRNMGVCLAEIRGWLIRSDNDDASQHSGVSKASSVHSLSLSQSISQIPSAKAQDEISVLSYGSGVHSSLQNYSTNEPLRTRSQPEGGGTVSGSSDVWGGESISLISNSFLPPVLRLKRKQSLNASKKKLLAKAGFDESLIRKTPRVLKSNINDKVDVRTLRWELEMAQEGIKQLDRLVDSNIAWVQSNCDMSSAMAHFSSRTIRKCKHMAAERIFNVLVEYQGVTVLWAFQIWNKYSKYLQVVDYSKKYCKIKSIEILSRIMHSSLFRQYARGWRPWKRHVQRAIFMERTAATVEIQKICRGFLGRIYKKRKFQSKKVVYIQCMYRKWKARRIVDNRYQQRIEKFRSMAATDIQNFLRGKVSIWRAKEEAQRRRRVKAAIKIQKIGRGNLGRRKFAQKVLESRTNSANSKQRQFSDLESIATLSLSSQSNSGSVPSTTRSVRSRTQQVSKSSSVRTANSSNGVSPKKKGGTIDSSKSSTSTTTAKGKTSEYKTKSAVTTDQKSQQPKQNSSTVSMTGDSLHSKEDSDQYVGSETEITTTGKSASQNVGSLPIPRTDKTTPLNSSRRSEHSSSLGSGRVHGNTPQNSSRRSEHSSMAGHNKVHGTTTSLDSARKSSPQSSRKPSPGLSREPKNSHGKAGHGTHGSHVANSAAQQSNISQSSHVKPSTVEKHSHTNAVHANVSHASNSSGHVPVPHASHSKLSTAEKHAGGTPITGSKPKQHSDPDSTPVAAHSNNTQHGSLQGKEKQVPENSKKKKSIVKDPIAKSTRNAEEKLKIPQVNVEIVSNTVIEAQEAEEKRRKEEVEELMSKKLLEAQQEKIKEEARKGPDLLPEKTSEIVPDQIESHILIQRSRDSSPVKKIAPAEERDISESDPSPSERLSNRIWSALGSGKSSRSPSPLRPFSSEKIMSGISRIGSWFALPGSASVKTRKHKGDSSPLSERSLSPSSLISIPPLEGVAERDEHYFGSEKSSGPRSADSHKRDHTFDRSQTPSRPSSHGLGPTATGSTENGDATRLVSANNVGSVSVEDTQKGYDPKPQDIEKSQAITKPEPIVVDPKYAAAIRIQQLIRKKLSRRRVQSRRQQMISAQAIAGRVIFWAAITIQRIGRGKLGRRRFNTFLKSKQDAFYNRRFIAATKIQCLARKRQARKKVSIVRERVMAERKQLEWLKSLQKEKKKSNDKKSTASAAKSARDEADNKNNDNSDRPKSAVKELDEKLRRLEELEKVMAEREQKMMEAARVAEERAAAMEETLRQMEEKARQEEADRLMRQQLLDMAAGPISNRSDYNAIMRSQQSHHSLPASARIGKGTGRMMQQIGYITPRVHAAPPTARSARDGSSIPPDAVKMHHEGEEWVRLWDPEERAYYWYCERTQAAQWDTPGAASNSIVPYSQSYNDDSGYESGGAMTDYSTDHYESGGEEFWDDNHKQLASSNSPWHEYWDDLAKAKYWYNSETGEATWTKPEQLTGVTPAPAAGKSGRNYNPQDWVSYIDEDTGQEYWYNSKTGEASWS